MKVQPCVLRRCNLTIIGFTLAEFGIVSYTVSVILFMAISIKLTGQRKSYFIMAVAPLQFLHIIGSFLMVLLFLVFKNLVDKEKLSRTCILN